MKMVETLKHHKTHKYTISGFVVGGILLLASVVDITMLKEPQYHPLSVYMTLVPGLALILRSLRPPMGILRSVTTVIGGAMLGATPMLLTSDNTQVLWLSLVNGLIGAGLLGFSFTSKTKKAEQETL